MYVCMYVCIQLEVLMPRPTHIVVARVPWPPTVLKSTVGGTPITHACPRRCLVSSGGTCMYRYIYIYCLCHCRYIPLLLRHADFLSA